KMKLAAGFFDSELGEAFRCQVISAGLIHIPIASENQEMKDALAKEFRIQGFTELGSMVVDYLADPLRESLAGLTSALKESNVLEAAASAAPAVAAKEELKEIKEVKEVKKA